MSKLPAIQFYPGDWRKDPGVQALDYEHRGVWFEILLLMHESDQRGRLLLNGKPMPEEALARTLGLDKQKLSKIVSTLLEYGVASQDSDGVIFSKRMVKDEDIRQKRAVAGKKGGKRSKPPSKPEAKPEAKRGSSYSSSISSSNKDINDRPEHWPSEKEWMDYCKNHGFHPDYAKDQFDKHEAVGWVTLQNQTPIQDWQKYANTRQQYQRSWIKQQTQERKNGTNKQSAQDFAKDLDELDQLEEVYRS